MEAGEYHVERNVKARAVKILSVLKYFYSFRELQEQFGIPFQALWKYANLLSMPERETAEKILSKASELKLVERALERFVKLLDVDLEYLASSPGFIKLFSFLTIQFLERAKIDSIIVPSEPGIPHAALVAVELNVNLCPVWREAPPSNRGMLTFYYHDTSARRLVPCIISKSCLKPRYKIAIIDLCLVNVALIDTLLDIISQSKASIAAVIAVDTSSSVKRLLESKEVRYIELKQLVGKRDSG